MNRKGTSKKMNELKNDFYNVMYKYQKSFGETGVMANLQVWAQNKASLLELLRRHPGWVEKEKAIVFNYRENRELDRGVIDEAAFFLEEMAEEQIRDAEEKESFMVAFRAAITEYGSTLSNAALEIIRSRGGIKCASGQKTSRIIGRLCRQFHVDAHSRYNSVYARLSDALNPLQIQKTAVLSLYPCDFLEMSNKDNTWISCHNIRDGGYQAGALSYMTDSVSMIFFTVDNEVTENFHRFPKRNRQMFFYRDRRLFQSRLYPDEQAELNRQYRSLVQKAIASCLGEPNFWKLITDRDKLDECCITVSGSRQYHDYAYYGNLSLLKAADGSVPSYESCFEIGAPPLCVCCGRPYQDRGALSCRSENLVVCKECGRTVEKSNARYADGAFYCHACLHICAVCGEMIHGAMFPAYNRRGQLVEICQSCQEAALAPCAGCSVRSICAIIGSQLCPRAAVTVTGGAA